MIPSMLTLGDNILPEVLQFLHVGWFVVHLVAIPVVFAIGFALGRKKAGGKSM